jgi:hypothetical protein
MIGKRIAAGRVYNFNNELTIRQLIFIIYLEVVKPQECQNSLGSFRTNRNTHTRSPPNKVCIVISFFHHEISAAIYLN